MTIWHAILLASIIVLATKLAGHHVPPAMFERPRPRRVMDLMTVSLLAGLVAVQTFAAGQALRIDARLPAAVVAVVLLRLRAPFLVVVVVAAIVAALLRRFAGLP